MEEKVRGILLHAIPYLGNATILKVLTAELGLIPLIAKKKFAGCTTPFCEVEWVFSRGKEEIHRLRDAALLESFSGIKKSLPTLQAAGAMAKELLRSQLPSKRGDGLYALVRSYFRKLPEFHEPELLVASFRVKLLRWEGLLALAEQRATYGEKTITFDSKEWTLVSTLAFARTFSELQQLEKAAPLFQTIEAMCQEALG